MSLILAANELKRVAALLDSADDKKYILSDLKKNNAKLVLIFHKDKWNEFGKKPEWIEITEWLNEDSKGNFHGIDHSNSKIGVDGVERLELTFNDLNDADHKSHLSEMKRDLETLGFKEKK